MLKLRTRLPTDSECRDYVDGRLTEAAFQKRVFLELTQGELFVKLDRVGSVSALAEAEGAFGPELIKDVMGRMPSFLKGDDHAKR